MPRETTQTLQGKPCRSCGTMLPLEATACTCGVLTDNATFKERAEFEVKQWRAYKARTSETA